MNCQFCGNEKVKSYIDCACKQAVKFKNQMNKGSNTVAQPKITECKKCDLVLMASDIIRVIIVGAVQDGNYKHEFLCPRCNTSTLVDSIKVKEKENG